MDDLMERTASTILGTIAPAQVVGQVVRHQSLLVLAGGLPLPVEAVALPLLMLQMPLNT